MKNYLNVKVLKAEMMNLGDYNKIRGWKIPENENPEEKGYKIINLDSSVTWCKKELFEKYSKEIKDQSIVSIKRTIDELKNYCCEISDGYHTFDELYYHRMILFSVICNDFKNLSWKSWKHEDGTMYDDYFIVGISTPQGDYSYHYHKDNWDYFKVRELEYAPKWDGHKPEDITRLLSL